MAWIKDQASGVPWMELACEMEKVAEVLVAAAEEMRRNGVATLNVQDELGRRAEELDRRRRDLDYRAELLERAALAADELAVEAAAELEERPEVGTPSIASVLGRGKAKKRKGGR